jgi:hypothetical protein
MRVSAYVEWLWMWGKGDVKGMVESVGICTWAGKNSQAPRSGYIVSGKGSMRGIALSVHSHEQVVDQTYHADVHMHHHSQDHPILG